MSPTLRRRFVVALLVAWCGFLIVARWVWTGHPAFGFLAWNLFLAAGTGLLLGYASTAEVHRVLQRRAGRVVGWSVACAALMLSGFGIYLGRFLRWNSWDMVSDPAGRLTDLVTRALHPAEHPRTLAVTLVYGVGLVLGYVALRALAHSDRDDAREP